jgi:RibD domain-containing protein
MAKLIYTAIASLDGYVEDEHRRFGWAKPDEEVHAFVNGLERPIGTYLYGRRMYETTVFWETASASGESPVFRASAALWRAADKVVYSRTLKETSSARTRSNASSIATRSAPSSGPLWPTSASVAPGSPARDWPRPG